VRRQVQLSRASATEAALDRLEASGKLVDGEA
jgi:hypothetical protein